MPLLLSAFYLLLVALTGYVASCILFGSKTRHWAEVAGLSFAGGAGIIGWILFVLSLAGIVPSRSVLLILTLTSIAALLLLRARGRIVRCTVPTPLSRNWDARTILGGFALLLIALSAANAFAQASTPGLADIDDFAIWMYKAKIVAAEPLLPVPSELEQPGLSYSHQDYPFSFPLLIAGASAAAGNDVQAEKLALVPIYLSLIAIAYTALRQMLRRADALVITALFACAPVLREHAGMAVAEVSLVLMHACCLVFLLRWMQNGNRRDLIASAGFAAFAALTKNEGLALFPIIAAAAIVFAASCRRRQAVVDWFTAFVIGTAIITPWLIYRHFLPHTHEDYGGKLTTLATLSKNLPRLWQIVPEYLQQLVDVRIAGAIWLVLLLSAIIGWRAFAQLPVVVLWLFVLVHLCIYLATLMVTPWDLNVLVPMVTAKLLMHITPAAMLLIGLHLSQFRAGAQPGPLLVRQS